MQDRLTKAEQVGYPVLSLQLSLTLIFVSFTSGERAVCCGSAAPESEV